MDDIKVDKTLKSCSSEFKTFLLTKAYELDYRELTYTNQLKLGRAIIRRESYIAGYPKAILRPKTFYKLWLKLHKEIKSNPANAPYVLKSKRGQNKKGYVDMLDDKFEGFLHETYRYATGLLGIAESTYSLCTLMN